MTQPILVAGVDEVGRGPLVGDVVAAAVILDINRPITGIDDSKKLTEKKREKLFAEILHCACCYSIGSASVAEIDRLNILYASLLAMERALKGLAQVPDLVRVDGNRAPNWQGNIETIIGGDAKFPEIGAASILAKVTRDRQMLVLDNLYPQYGFAQHKGYPTVMHRDALQRFGPTPYHRRSFAPVKRILEIKERELE